MTQIGSSRALTVGEIAMTASVFGDQINPARVRVHRRKWWPLQPKAVVMAPRGSLWFHPDSEDWREDYATESLSLRAFIVHELAHVWQHQRGINLILRRLPLARYRYLPMKPGKPFEDYGIEQQAEIVRHAFILREGGTVPRAPPIESYAALLPFGYWLASRPSRVQTL